MSSLNRSHKLGHTPGPVAVASATMLYAAGEAGDTFIVHEITAPYGANPEDFQTLAFMPESEVSEANGRLFAAGFNAFTTGAKKLGLNAMEFAERMQDGEMAELLYDLVDATNRLESCIGSDCECDNTHEQNTTVCCLCQYRSTIAKARGGKWLSPHRS